jgi:lysophospholipase L1-like esterase
MTNYLESFYQLVDEKFPDNVTQAIGASDIRAAMKNLGQQLYTDVSLKTSGWTPVISIVADGVRSVQKVVDWTGGQGTKPPVGQYIGANGFVSAIAQAVDVRGQVGQVGPAGAITNANKAVISRNLFNPANVQVGKAVNTGGSGELYANFPGWILSEYMAVVPGEKYTFSGVGAPKGIRYEDAAHALISGSTIQTAGTTVTIPANAAFMIFTVKTDAESGISATFQLEKGTVATTYQAFQQAVATVDGTPLQAAVLANGVKLASAGTDPDSVLNKLAVQALFSRQGVLNLFDPTKAVLNKAVDFGGNGTLYAVFAGFAISDYIAVLPGEKYTFSNVGVKKGIRFEDATHTLVTGGGGSLSSTGPTTVTVPASAVWMVFGVKADTEESIPATFQLQRGTVATAYQAYQQAVVAVDGNPVMASVLADGAKLYAAGTDPNSLMNRQGVETLLAVGILPELSVRPGANLFNPANVQINKAVDQGGNGMLYNGLTGWNTSEYMAVLPGEKYTFSGLLGVKGLRFEAADHSLISGFSLQAAPTTVTVPANAAWMLFNVKINSESSMPPQIQVEKGTSATAYSPYGSGQLEKVHGYSLVPYYHQTTTGKKLLIFGDSIATMWPSYIQMPYWGAVSNFAISSAWVKDKAVFTDAGESFSIQIQRAIDAAAQADVIIMCLGTNDSPTSNIGTYETAMAKTTLESLDRSNSFYEALRYAYWKISLQWPNAKLFHATPLQRADRTLDLVKQIADAIRKMAATYCVQVIEAQAESGIVGVFEVANGQGKYLTDGVHPSTAGRKLLADYYMRKLITEIV